MTTLEMETQQEENTNVAPKKIDLRRKPGRKKKKFKVPRMPIPVRALWETASQEEQQTAHLQAIVIMEYWMGHLSKMEASKKLEVAPLRIWQMAQMALAGMCAGLLKQPKTRNTAMIDKDNDPTELKKRIQEMEKTIDMQERLISILRSMPGCTQVGYRKMLEEEKKMNSMKEIELNTGVKRGARRPKGQQKIQSSN